MPAAAPARRSIHLPYEIEELVFRRLDRPQLVACAAVCARWHARLVARVFASIPWMDVRCIVRLVDGVEAAAQWKRAQLTEMDCGVDGADDRRSGRYLASTPCPLVYVKRLDGWYEPRAEYMGVARIALARFCNLVFELAAHPNGLIAAAAAASASQLLAKAAQADAIVPVVDDARQMVLGILDEMLDTTAEVCKPSHMPASSSADTLVHLPPDSKSPRVHHHAIRISAINADSNFVPDALLLRLAETFAASLVQVRLNGFSAASLTGLAVRAHSLSTLELSSERDEFKISLLNSSASFNALKHLTITSTSDRPRYSLLTVDALATPALTRLDLFFVHITDTTLQRLLLRNRPTLTHLSVGYVTGLSDGALGMVPFLCPSLTALDLTYTNISDAALEAISRQTRAIQRLVLVGNHKVSDAGLAVIADAWGDSLVHLDLGMMRATAVTDTGLSALFARCTALRDVRLRQLDALTLTLTPAASAVCPVFATPSAHLIERLDIRGCAGVALDTVAKIVTDTRMRALRSVNVAGEYGDTADLCAMVASLRRPGPSIHLAINDAHLVVGALE